MRYDLPISEMTWSYSRLRAFEECPYDWLCRYIFGQPDEGNFFSDYGTLVHELLADFFAGRVTAKTAEERFTTRFFGLPSSVESPELRAGWYAQGRAYFKTLPDSIPEDRTILGTEQKFHYPFAGKPFVGIIDLLSEDSVGRLYITDHKSHNLKPRSTRKIPTKKDAELDSYLRQLYCYAAAVHHEWGRWPDFLEFNCFRTGTWITEPFDPAAYRATEDWVEILISKIETNDNWPAVVQDFRCRHLCGSRADCEFFRT